MKAEPYSDQKNWSDTYLTDPKLLGLLGPFDLDPCIPEDMPWHTAHYGLTKSLDGLSADWSKFGNGKEKPRVFMNPPYRGVIKWAEKFAHNRNGVALLNGRSTETRATQLIMNWSHSIWFPKGRLSFYKVDGTPWPQKWFPSLLIGMTKNDTSYLEKACEVYGGEVYFR